VRSVHVSWTYLVDEALKCFGTLVKLPLLLFQSFFVLKVCRDVARDVERPLTYQKNINGFVFGLGDQIINVVLGKIAAKVFLARLSL